MKAPDVIYLHKIRDEESSGYYSQWFDSRARCVPSEKYIRKDALLERIDEILNSKPDGGLAVDIAALSLIDIKKVINSM